MTTHYLEEAEQLSDRVAIMNYGQVVAIGTPDEIIAAHGSGERLEIHSSRELASYLREKTNLKVNQNRESLISITIDKKHDALIALTAIEESGLDWNDLRIRRDSLEDVFLKLVSGIIGEHGEIKVVENNNGSSASRGGA